MTGASRAARPGTRQYLQPGRHSRYREPRDIPATGQAIRPGHAGTASGTQARTHAAHGASSVLIPVRSTSQCATRALTLQAA